MRVLKWIGIIILILLIIFVGIAAVVYAKTGSRIGKKYNVHVQAIKVPTGAAAIARGRHLVIAVGKCTDCHGEDLAGDVFIDDPVVGRYVATNLTGSDKKENFSTANLVMSMRQGVDPESKQSLIFMPSYVFRFFSDKDLGAIIAYLKTLKPVKKNLPTTSVGPLARVLYLQGKFPLLAAEMIQKNPAPKPKEPAPGVSVAYGKYLVDTGGCRGCHGENLKGGPIPEAPPGTPPASNLTFKGDIKKWTEADYVKALRQGVEPNREKINSFMPWKGAGKMTDEEIRATWLYLRTVK